MESIFPTRPVFGILQFAPLIFAWMITRRLAGPDFSRREILSAAVLLHGLFTVLITELLSFFSLLNAPALFALYGTAAAMVAFMGAFTVFRRWSRGAPVLPRLGEIPILGRPVILVCVAAAVMILLLTFAQGLLATANSWDSMTYHLSRVAHWAANGSTAHYATHISRQLYLAPLSEYYILHSYLLSGGDFWANTTQWFFCLGSAVMLSLIIRELGGNERAQWLIPFFMLAAPMTVLQASGTQNDLAAAYWLLCLVFYILRYRRSSGGLLDHLGPGAALALGGLTKGTIYIFALPLLIYYGLNHLRRFARSPRLFYIVVVPLIFLLVNGPYLARNLMLFGHPLSDPAMAGRVSNEVLSFAGIASNIIRNLALHSSLPGAMLHEKFVGLMELIHSGLGISMTDPRFTFAQYRIMPAVPHEDLAGNPIQTLVLLASAMMILFRARKVEFSRLVYAGSCAGALLLFSIILKAQTWHVRLQLPLFWMSAPLVFLALEGLFRSESPAARRVLTASVLILLLGALPFIIFNRSRPYSTAAGLLTPRTVYFTGSILTEPREEFLFANRFRLREDYMAGAKLIRESNCRRGGLIAGEDSWEYPLWKLTPGTGWKHVDVKNASGRLEGRETFCVLVVLNGPAAKSMNARARVFTRTYRGKEIQVYFPETILK